MDLDTFEVSQPVLQTPSERSVCVSWVVSALSAGYVDIADNPGLSDYRRVAGVTGGIVALDDRFLSVRIEGLKPATRYYYRTVTVPVDYPDAYRVSCGTGIEGEIHAFTTMGVNADSSFAVINDTHESVSTMRAIGERLRNVDASVTVWNGDVAHQFPSADHAATVMRQLSDERHAAGHPVLFTPGNHDYRGVWARCLTRMFPLRPASERGPRFHELGRNFAVRQGDIALIGLDTGEDKPDHHPAWAGLAMFDPYRELQAEWLHEVCRRPEIDSAPYIVVICHIPLFDGNPDANPGDRLEGYAIWQRKCADLWAPVFEKHGVQLVVSGHTHRYRFDPPDETRCWAQVVGGGFQPEEKRDVTVIDGRVDDDRLIVTAYNAAEKSEIERRDFRPRVSRPTA